MASEPEPVAWRTREMPGHTWKLTDYDPARMGNTRNWEAQPLYTAAALLAAEQRGGESAAKKLDTKADWHSEAAGLTDNTNTKGRLLAIAASLREIAAAIRKGE